MKKEIIHVHVGNAGVQIGDSLWKQYCLEHGINEKGLDEKSLDNDEKGVLFQETENGWKPRTVFVDTDPSTMESLSKGWGRNLYNGNVLTGKESTASVCIAGTYTAGKKVGEEAVNLIEKKMEGCDSVGAVIITHSMSGGTGTGVVQLIMNRLNKKLCKHSMMVIPSTKMSNEVVEPYNFMLTFSEIAQQSSHVTCFQNDAIYDRCTHLMNNTNPKYQNINQVIAQTISTITQPFRMESDGLLGQYSELTEMLNATPQHNISIPVLSHRNNETWNPAEDTIAIAKALWKEPLLGMTKAPILGRYTKHLRSMTFFRGEFDMRHMGNAMYDMMMDPQIRFMDGDVLNRMKMTHCPTPIPIIDNTMTPQSHTACMLLNTSAISPIIRRENRKFHKLYATRAFVFWFLGEGIRSRDFASMAEESNILGVKYREYADDDHLLVDKK